jgi:hypothetical protein
MIRHMLDSRRRSRILGAVLALAFGAACGAGPTPSASVAATASSPPPTLSPATPLASPTPSSSATPSASPAANCSDTTAPAPSSTPFSPADDPNAPLYARIETQVQKLRGLTATRPVPRNILSPAGLCAFLREKIATAASPDVVAATDRLYKQLLLLPKDGSLAKSYLDMMAGQAIGLYDDQSKQMYVVSTTGTIGPLEQWTYSHEFDHALQDQAFDLRKLRGTATDQSDRSTARTMLTEGDATLLMSLWAQGNLTADQLAQLANGVDPAAQAALDAAPPIVREPQLAYYTSGLTLALGAWQQTNSFDGVNALFRNPPDTTEQVMHPEKLASREPAVAVSFPPGFAGKLGKGWKVALEDTFGEFVLGILIRTGKPDAGADPAAGWGGDRVALVEGPNGGEAAIVDTTWDTAQAAAAYYGEIQALAAKLNAAGFRAAALIPGDRRVVLLSADSDRTLTLVAGVMGLAQ